MYNERLVTILTAFGLRRESKLPVEGATARYVDGVLTWIVPRVNFHRKPHRVMQECPVCGSVVSAARMPQHVSTATCVDKMLRKASQAGDDYPRPLGATPHPGR